MKNSRVDGPGLRSAGAGILGALALLALAPPVLAADPEPPSTQESAPPAAEAPAPPPADLRPVISRPGANDAPIDVGALGAPDTSGVGLMSEAEGGLSPAMWQGTDAVRAAALLAGEPRPTRSRALQGLARRLLLSEARPPEGMDGAGPSFLSLRLSRLLALGDFDSVLQLSNPVQPSAATDGEVRVRVEAFLLRNDEASACALAGRMRRAVSDPYWAKLGAYCDVRSGNVPAAELAVGLLKQQGYEDPVFYALYDWLVIPPSKDKPAPPPKPAKGKKAAKRAKAVKPAPPRTPPTGDGSVLSFAMLRAAKLPLGEDSVTAGRPALLHALALDETETPPDARLAAATEAASFGAFPLGDLRALYGGQPFSPEALRDPAGISSGLQAGQALAIAYQSVEQAGATGDRIHFARVGYQTALARGYGALFAALVQPDLGKLAPDPALSPEIPGLVELLLAAGSAELGYSWFGLIDERQDNDSADPRQLDHLSDLLRIAQPSERLTWTPPLIKRQLDRAALQGSAAMAQRSFEMRVLEALGYPIPPEVAAALPPVPPVIGTGLPAFEDAVAGHRMAEAILIACQLLGTDGPAAAPPGTTLALIRGFVALGLEDDARALGLEAALASVAARS
jgi:hypothetical protein